MESCQVLCENTKSPEFTLFRPLLITSGSQQVGEEGIFMGILLTFTRLFVCFLCSRQTQLSSRRLSSDSLLCSCPVLHRAHSISGSFAGSPWVFWHSVCIEVLNLSQQICIFALQLVGSSWRKCHPVPLTWNIVYLSQTDLTPLFYPCTKSVLGRGLRMSLVFQTDAKGFIEPLFCPYHPKLILCRALQLTGIFRALPLPFSRLGVSHLALVSCLPK